MTEPKTKPGTQSVTEFLNAVPDGQKRKDSKVLVAMMRSTTRLLGQLGKHSTGKSCLTSSDWPTWWRCWRRWSTPRSRGSASGILREPVHLTQAGHDAGFSAAG